MPLSPPFPDSAVRPRSRVASSLVERGSSRPAFRGDAAVSRTAKGKQQCSPSRVLVVGTGLLLHLLGSGVNALTSWTHLIQSLRTRDPDRSSPGKGRDADPIEAWEETVREQVNVAGRDIPAYRAESLLRKALSARLKDAAEAAEGSVRAHSLHRRLSARLEAGGLHLVSLNFDGLAYAGVAVNKVWPPSAHLPDPERMREADSENLYQRRVVVGRRADGQPSMIWHPHGRVERPEGIRTGLRDYGLQPYAYARAFDRYKNWETRMLGGARRAKPLSRDHHRLLVRRLDELDASAGGRKPDPADTWITRFMLLPVDLIGVGISRQEIGLRWLLNQRARNLARIPERQAPLIHRVADEWLPPAWAECRLHPDWDAAWSEVLAE